MRKKGIIGIALVAAMAASLCACGNENNSGTTTSTTAGTTAAPTTAAPSGNGETTATPETTAKTVEKPASISWWTHDGLNEEDYVKEWDAKFSEVSGVTMEHTQVSNNEYHELLEVAFASGTEPNIFDLSCDQKVAYYASQGAIADLTDLIQESGIYDRVDPAVWEAISIDGRIYGIPRENSGGVVNYARQDWLDQLGLAAPKNFEEYLNMLRSFRDNVEQCKIPLTVPGLHLAMNLPEFYWDAEADITYKDGQWVDGMLEESFSGAMQRLQDAYAEGLIDTEAVTNTTSACRDKWYSGEVGVFSYWAGKWGNTLETRIQENFPDAKLATLDAIEESYYRHSGFNILCIDGRLSEEEIEKVFYSFFGTIFDGAEGQELMYCGVEGLHFEYDTNGDMQYLNMKSNAESVFQSVWGSPWSAVVAFNDETHLPKPSDKAIETEEVLARTGKYKATTPSSNTLNTITSDLTAIRQEMIAKVIMGSMTVEEGMESYAKQAKALGIDQVLAEMNQ